MRRNVMAVLGTVCLAAAVYAQQDGACRADAEKFCKDVQPGGGRVMQCLKQHEAELSDGCKSKGQETKEKVNAAIDACDADAQKFCKDVEPGEGRLAKCLKSHEAELSTDCKAKTAELRQLKPQGPCAEDAAKFCKDSAGMELAKCLKSHESELSEGCKTKAANIKAKAKDISKACSADVKKLCAGVKPGQGRIAMCLKEKEAELSDSCKAAIAGAEKGK